MIVPALLPPVPELSVTLLSPMFSVPPLLTSIAFGTLVLALSQASVPPLSVTIPVASAPETKSAVAPLLICTPPPALNALPASFNSSVPLESVSVWLVVNASARSIVLAGALSVTGASSVTGWE